MLSGKQSYHKVLEPLDEISWSEQIWNVPHSQALGPRQRTLKTVRWDWKGLPLGGQMNSEASSLI